MQEFIFFDYKEYYESDNWKELRCPDETIGFIKISDNDIIFNKRLDFDNIYLNPSDHNDYTEKKDIKVEGKIAVILESPHIDEFVLDNVTDFSSKNDVFARPANGATGKNFTQYFCEIFKDSLLKLNLDSGFYSITLFNSIQHQCSLGTDTNIYRDRIWTRCWFGINDYKNNFIERLSKFKPEIIINCATVGSHYRISTINNSKKYDLCKKPLSFTKSFLKEEFGDKVEYEQSKANIQKIITENILENKILDKDKVLHSTHPSSWYSGKNRIVKGFEKVGLKL